MDLIQELRLARSTPKTVLFRLLLNYRPSGGTIHAFFEGQDDESFYVNFLQFYLPDDYQLFLYRCRGKAGVYAVFHGAERPKFDHRRLIFFVDRDYADILGEEWPTAENIFTTDYYSIENHVVVESTFRRYLRDILHLDHFVEDEEALARHFNEQLAHFHQRMLILAAWTVYVRQNGFRPNLANIGLDQLFDVSPDLELRNAKSRPASILDYVDKVTGVSTPRGNWISVLAIARRLKRTLSPKVYTRGKFELWFFVEFVLRIPALLNKYNAKGVQRIAPRTQISRSNAMEVLAPRVKLPDSLKRFLDHNFARLPH